MAKDKEDEDDTKRGCSSAKVVMQDEDDPYTYACHMVESHPLLSRYLNG